MLNQQCLRVCWLLEEVVIKFLEEEKGQQLYMLTCLINIEKYYRQRLDCLIALYLQQVHLLTHMIMII